MKIKTLMSKALNKRKKKEKNKKKHTNLDLDILNIKPKKIHILSTKL